MSEIGKDFVLISLYSRSLSSLNIKWLLRDPQPLK